MMTVKNDTNLINENIKLTQENKRLMAELEEVKRQRDRLHKTLVETRKLLKHYHSDKVAVYNGEKTETNKLSKFAEYLQTIASFATCIAGLYILVRLFYFVTGCIATWIMG